MQSIKKLIPGPIKSFIRSHANGAIILLKLMAGASATAPTKSHQQYKQVLATSIESAKDPIQYLNTLTTELSVDPQTIWHSITDLYARSAKVIDDLQSGADGICDWYLRTHLYIKKSLRTQGSMSLTAFYELSEKCNLKSADITVVSRLRPQLASVAITKLSCGDLEDGLESLALDIDTLTHTQKINLIKRKIMGRDERLSSFYKERFKSSLQEIEKLKILILENEFNKISTSSYRTIEEDFSLITHQAVDQYNKHIRNIYARIPVHKNFIDARINFEKRDAVRRIILDTIINELPFSFIRLGDGESYGFADDLFLTEKAYSRQELHWWGEVLPTTLRKELQRNFKDSLASVSLLGIPTVFRFCSVISSSADKPIIKDSLIARLISVTKNCLPSVSADAIYVEEQSNLFLFDLPFLMTLIATARRVVVVSGLSEEKLRPMNLFLNHENLRFIEIPTHRMLRAHAMSTAHPEILPFSYSGYLSTIEELSEPGVLVLVSAGFIGKIFIARAAKHGAVALDVGQQLLHAANELGKHETV